MMLRVSRRLAAGIMFDANYTWSKNIDDTDTVEDNQGFNAGGGARGNNHSLSDFSLNRRLGYSDIPHRFVGTFLYELPFGTGKPINVPTSVLRAIVGDWQVGGSVIWQTGLPDRRHGRERRRGADASESRRRRRRSCCPRTCGAGTTAARRSRCRAAA